MTGLPRTSTVRHSLTRGTALLLTLFSAMALPQLSSASEIMVVRTAALTPTAAPGCRTHHSVLRQGTTLSGVLSKLYVPQSQVLQWNARLPKGYRARDLRPGDSVLACLGGGGTHHDLVGLEIAKRHGHHAVLGHFPSTDKSAPMLAAAFTPPSTTALSGGLRRVDFKLDGPLSKALASQHLSRVETTAIEAWLHSDADLPAQMPQGTRIGLLLGRGPGDRSEQLLRLRIWYQGNMRELFDYVDKDGRSWVLNRNGMGILNLRLKKPVDYTRISSGWGWRDQPVLHVPEFHKGIDFAAPMGTAVHAAASGVIKFSGWHGNYGRLIILQHTSNTQTRYAHLSRVAAGIHPGSHVSTGQVIGYVGSSGLSTGPHLYFELFMHDLRVDPLTTAVNLPVRLAGPILHAFHHYVSQIDDLRPALADAG